MNSQPSFRIKGLDGWRGIAVLMVLVEHYQAAFSGQGQFNLGQHGVQIFFVLSGFLITTLLLSENPIDLKSFYTRRAFRILPASLAYLSVLIILTTFTPFHVVGNDVWACLFFFRNYVAETALSTCTGHFWSLSLEEQFYMVWPLVLVLMGRRRATYFAAGSVAFIAVFRILTRSYYSVGLRALHTEVRADGLMVGCLLALALSYTPIRQWFERYCIWFLWPALAIFVGDIILIREYIPLHESIVIAIMLGATSLAPKSLIGSILEWDHLKTTGVISYSIYIWQGLFLRPNWGAFWPLLLGSSILLSYFFIEKPARRLGHRLSGRRAISKSDERAPSAVVLALASHSCTPLSRFPASGEQRET